MNNNFSQITNIITLNTKLYSNSYFKIDKNIFLEATNGAGKTTLLNLLPFFLGVSRRDKDANVYFNGVEDSYIIIEYKNYTFDTCSVMIFQEDLDFRFIFFKLTVEKILYEISNYNGENFQNIQLKPRNEILKVYNYHLQNLNALSILQLFYLSINQVQK